MTDRELAACPCCGSPAKFVHEHGRDASETWIACTGCLLATRRITWLGYGIAASDSLADAWNRREPGGEDARDAERYRFIRSLASATPVEFAAVEDAAWAAMHGLPHNFDLNIDAAMAKEKA